MKSTKTEIWGSTGYWGWSAWIGKQEVRCQLYYGRKRDAVRGLDRFLARQGRKA